MHLCTICRAKYKSRVMDTVQYKQGKSGLKYVWRVNKAKAAIKYMESNLERRVQHEFFKA